MRRPAGRRQRGYTLIEALVAVAIIGMISLVAVPNFIVYYRAGRIKTSLRQFTTELRAARQQAVSEQGCAMISFLPGTTTDTSRTYSVYIGTYSAGVCSGWTLTESKILEQSVFFKASTFTDDVDLPASSNTVDIIFRQNGTTKTTPIEARNVLMQTNMDVPKDKFLVTMFPSGQLKVTEP